MELSVAEALAQAEQLFRAGRLEEMERLCRSILEAAPNGAEAHRFLGLAAYARGRHNDAVGHVRRALELAPGEAAAHDNLSLFLLALGRPVEAEEAARQALALQPSLAGAAYNLGLALQRQGRVAQAESPLRQFLAQQPNDPDAWNSLAAILDQLGRAPEAVVALERALQLRPDFPLARQNLRRLRALLPTDPSAAEEAHYRGVQRLAQKRYAEAEAAFRRALLLVPEWPEPAYNLAKILLLQQQYGEVEELLRKVLSQRPNWAAVHYHLGFLYTAQRRLSDAEAAYRRAVELEPDQVKALNNLGASVLNNEGRIDEARAVYQQALALQPDHASCHSNLLFNEHYAPGATLAGLAKSHADWERRFAVPLRSTWRPFAQAPDPDRPLRLGFVSGDLFFHPVGLFLAPVLERLNRKQWFSVCYANQEQNDELTRRLGRSASLWRWVSDLSDEALAEQVRGDGIDLLIDLSGHTGRNRLLTFARRTAPVQLTWAGYVGTTGLSAIDYLIADRFHIPPGWEEHYREQVLRLPDGYICYQPPAYAPPIGPLPARTMGQVTFGSFNNTSKITAPVVAVWADILRRLPGSRLVLKYHWLDDAGLQRRLRDLFKESARMAGSSLMRSG